MNRHRHLRAAASSPDSRKPIGKITRTVSLRTAPREAAGPLWFHVEHRQADSATRRNLKAVKPRRTLTMRASWHGPPRQNLPSPKGWPHHQTCRPKTRQAPTWHGGRQFSSYGERARPGCDRYLPRSSRCSTWNIANCPSVHRCSGKQISDAAEGRAARRKTGPPVAARRTPKAYEHGDSDARLPRQRRALSPRTGGEPMDPA